jgi:hypothetical protein
MTVQEAESDLEDLRLWIGGEIVEGQLGAHPVYRASPRPAVATAPEATRRERQWECFGGRRRAGGWAAPRACAPGAAHHDDRARARPGLQLVVKQPEQPTTAALDDL